LPSWWGVLVAEDGVLREHRAGEQHAPEPGPLVRMLWKDEMRALYRAHGIRLAAREYVHDLWRRVDAVPLDALRAAVRVALKDRCEPGGVREHRAAVRAEQAVEERRRKEDERVRAERITAFVARSGMGNSQ
jgi:hypothetical protein